jgi:serine/threonine protein phosphatase PrpC
MTKCPNCGQQNAPGVQICVHCRMPLSAAGPSQHEGTDRRAQGQEEKPLLRTGVLDPRHLPFEALPQGSIIDRYIVLTVYKESRQINYYLVEDMVDTVVPKRRWLLKEAADVESIRGELALLNRSLSHPALRLANHGFVEEDYNLVERHYLVLPGMTLVLLDAIDLPVELDKALGWIAQLAEGLSYLHDQQVALGQVTPQHVCIEDDSVQWFDLGRAKSPATEADTLDDIIGLGELLLFMLTGQDGLDALNAVRLEVQAFVRRAVQGTYTGADQFQTALRGLAEQIRHPHTADLCSGRCTDVGQARQLNEDSLLTFELTQVNQSIGASLGVYAVADGMGGNEAGEVASGIAIETLVQHLGTELLPLYTSGSQMPAQDVLKWMYRVTRVANERVYERRQVSGNNLGCTLVWAIVVDQGVYVANVGDSRAYLVDNLGLTQITTDHSMVQRLVDAGRLTHVEAQSHPQKHVIYRAIGEQQDVQVDVWGKDLPAGGWLLLCSDGLTDMVSEQSIHQIIASSPHPQLACEHLVEAANRAGGADNISVVVVERVVPPS